MDAILGFDRAAPALQAVIDGRSGDPFAALGPHLTEDGRVVRVFVPGARAVEIADRDSGRSLGMLTQAGDSGLFTGPLESDAPYLLRIEWPVAVQETEDPYSFGVVLSDLDLFLFGTGQHWDLADRFGAVPDTIEGIAGVRFAVWAPNARRVSVVGDFNAWDGRRHPMRRRGESGVWELFVPRLTAGERYKYEMVGPDWQVLPQKADPIARAAERPPCTASVVAPPSRFRWTDGDWIADRAARQSTAAPISIYEVHAGSWVRPEGDPAGMLDWSGLAERLIPYASRLGFTHIELLPIMEHPFIGSWGYQPLSQFAPSARFGKPEDFAGFVDAAHQAGLGVILDWVPAHFPTDPHGLARFDGTALYEHADPREGFQQDWNTLIYNLGRPEVRGFLIASALYWLETFHVDGLRVDAVASMLYRDYSRRPGEWVPNKFGGRENLEAVDFIRRLNQVVGERCSGAITIAEESTSWPGVSAPVAEGGLGFSYKWNMGWMHDSLDYLGTDPLFRRWQQNKLTFGLMYAFSERFVLPLSHDEVVHGKGSLYGRAPGDPWQKLANIRAYFTFMWTHPGKKLLFMGNEIAQPREWNHDGEIDWDRLADPLHGGLQRLVTRLNGLYAAEPALHGTDADPAGFQWVSGDDAEHSVFAYLRRGTDRSLLLIVLNMTPVVRDAYRVGVPVPGAWRQILDSDDTVFGGSGVGNVPTVQSEGFGAHGQSQSLLLSLPPLGALVFKHGG